MALSDHHNSDQKTRSLSEAIELSAKAAAGVGIAAISGFHVLSVQVFHVTPSEFSMVVVAVIAIIVGLLLAQRAIYHD